MRVDERFGPVMRVDENYKRLDKMADVFELFSDTQEKPEASDVSSTSDSWSNDSDGQQFDKRQKTKKKKRGNNEQKQGHRKKKEHSRQLSCNSHCSFDRAMRVEETLMQTLACQLSSTLILV